MTVALDASMLILLFDAHAKAPVDASTGVVVSHAQERLRHFLNTYSRPKGSQIIIPTPALSEFLVRAKPEHIPEYLGQLQRIRGCHIAPFSSRAAIELAEMLRALLSEGGRLRKLESETRAKAKFDQQIVAIAKVEGATTIYSDDVGLKNFAARFAIETIGIAQLPLSPDSARGSLTLEPPIIREDNVED
ncbi:hypothetical protein [Beijerinckia sp. L45]|uniref:hypothetical protein n=1 Tax=Beijerinckia sp. L45 TaxID=1641855 RepID=UPI00131D718A|nr:hypothetical protein [Beijerinckia sp. L45]